MLCTFEELKTINSRISEGTLKYIKHKKYTHCTPVQQFTIPILLQNNDIAAESSTGSGKTLAYLVPVLERTIDLAIKYKDELEEIITQKKVAIIGSIILLPTRELVEQLEKIVNEYIEIYLQSNQNNKIGTIKLFGGREISIDNKIIFSKLTNELRINILITTPGRLSTHILNYKKNVSALLNSLDFKFLDILIIDEADKIFNEKIQKLHLETCLSYLPKQIRKGIFSATLSSDYADYIKNITRNLKIYTNKLNSNELANEHHIPTTLKNYYMILPYTHRFIIILNIIASKYCKKIIIFFLTCRIVDYYYNILNNLLDDSTKIYKIHGKSTKSNRQTTLENFNYSANSTITNILLASNLVSRGIDFQEVDLIIQFDAPTNSAECIHRMGRTARAGKNGKNLIFISESELAYINFLTGRSLEITYVDTNNILKELYGTENLCNNIITIPIIDITISDKANTINYGIDYNEINLSNYDALANFFNPIDPNCVVNYVNYLRYANINDILLYELAKKSYISHIRAYTEHSLKFIFQQKFFDIYNLALSYGLFKVIFLKDIKEYRTKLSNKIKDIHIPLSLFKFKREIDKVIYQKMKNKTETVKVKSDKFSPNKSKAKLKHDTSNISQKKKRQFKNILMHNDLEEILFEERSIKQVKRAKKKELSKSLNKVLLYADIDE